MPSKRILISGGGIAGLTLAYWLRRRGFEATVIESAPGPRGGGYMIDFWGLGYDVAERMSLLEELRDLHYEIPSLDFVDENDRIAGRFPVRVLRKCVGGRHFSLLRSDLERVLFEHARHDVDLRFSTSISEIHEDLSAVQVKFEDGSSERFDLLVGAEGLRSSTRRQVFGPDEKFERFLGYYVASFTVDDPSARRDAFRMFSVPGKQVGLYSVAGGKLAAFFIFRQSTRDGHLSVDARKKKLAEVFADVGWETPGLLERMHEAPDFYFDAVSQIRMPSWSRRRVALVGDACQCVSLVAGQGSALAMAGAFILAEQLERAGGRYAEAFAWYQAMLMPEIERKQDMAERFASSFVPASRFGIAIRNQFAHLMFVPFIARYFVKRFMADTIQIGAD